MILLQLANASSPIVVREAGMIKCPSSAVQFLNAAFPIAIILLFSIILFRLVHS